MEEYKSPAVLQQLYWKEGLSLSKISRRFDIARPSLAYWFKKYGIRTRPVIKCPLSKEELEELYVKKKLSSIKVAKIAGMRSRSTILRWLKVYKIPIRSQLETVTKHQKYPFSEDLCEKAYLIGLRMGDITASKERRQIRVSTTTTHPAQIQLMQEVFGKYSHVHYYPFTSHYGYKEVVVYSLVEKSFKFLLEKFGSIPQWIIDDDKSFLFFLAGFMDSEGCWYIGKGSHKSTYLMFQLSSTHKEWLEQIKSKLKDFGIESSIYSDKKISRSHYGSKAVYDLQVTRKSEVILLAKKLLSLSKHSEKIRKMILILKTKETNKWVDIRDAVFKLREEIKGEASLVKLGEYQECECNLRNLSTSLHPISVL